MYILLTVHLPHLSACSPAEVMENAATSLPRFFQNFSEFVFRSQTKLSLGMRRTLENEMLQLTSLWAVVSFPDH